MQTTSSSSTRQRGTALALTLAAAGAAGLAHLWFTVVGGVSTAMTHCLYHANALGSVNACVPM